MRRAPANFASTCCTTRRSFVELAPARSSISTTALKCLTASRWNTISSWRPALNQSMYTLVSMTSRCMSREELLELSRPRDATKRGIDLRFGHNNLQRAVERFRLGLGVQNLPRLVQLRLVDAQVLVSNAQCCRHESVS